LITKKERERKKSNHREEGKRKQQHQRTEFSQIEGRNSKHGSPNIRLPYSLQKESGKSLDQGWENSSVIQHFNSAFQFKCL
jgi:hypothetical protein